MQVTNTIRTFDKIALRLFHSVVLLGLGVVAFGAVIQSIQV
jgi:hypothetical protein